MTRPRVVHGAKGLRALVGEHVGYSEWRTVTQDRVNRFADMAVNHGLDRVRFPAPVPVGCRVRGGVVVEGGGKPVCVARYLQRRYP